jgi:hypothetical protein
MHRSAAASRSPPGTPSGHLIYISTWGHCRSETAGARLPCECTAATRKLQKRRVSSIYLSRCWAAPEAGTAAAQLSAPGRQRRLEAAPETTAAASFPASSRCRRRCRPPHPPPAPLQPPAPALMPHSRGILLPWNAHACVKSVCPTSALAHHTRGPHSEHSVQPGEATQRAALQKKATVELHRANQSPGTTIETMA